MKSFLLILAFCAAAVCAFEYTAEALEDEIKHLPDAPSVGFRQFSGYIPVSDSRQIFYWFVESQGSPSSDPVVMWTNGGPGCSGLGGFFTEQGPFRPDVEGKLSINKFSWNTVANMIFIEQPAGVGFSTNTDPNFKYGDKQAADDNYAFIVGFFKKFPNFKTNAFYITSESYGGHYMPTLAVTIVLNGGVPQFRGLAVGNPLTYMPYRDFGQFGTWAYHQLIPKPMWDDYVSHNCVEDKSSSPACRRLEDDMSELVGDLDPYGLDFPICDTAGAAGRNERHHFMKMIARSGALKGPYFPEDYEPCDSDWTATYLNRDDVQAAIHAKKPAEPWADCSDTVGNHYNQTDVALPMMSYYKQLVGFGNNLNILVYSGDDDSICATLGSQQFIWNLGFPVVKPWAPWKLNTTNYGPQVGGFHVEFKGMHFATVHGAGHMVPSTRPAQGLELFKKFLAGEW